MTFNSNSIYSKDDYDSDCKNLQSYPTKENLQKHHGCIDCQKINWEYLVVLMRSNQSNRIEAKYFKIKKQFEDFLFQIKTSKMDAKEKIKAFQENKQLEILSRKYKYCENPNFAFQDFEANHLKRITLASTTIESQSNENDYNKEEKNIKSIDHLIKEYELWDTAYSIGLAYNECHKNKEIVAFSHANLGWAAPEHQIENNLHLKFDTNFGYGRSSYFYITLRYKNLPIHPFSEWILYRSRKTSEIIRYTRKYEEHHCSWIKAMEFAQNAHNDFIENENLFIEKYIIEEVEEMVSGLEEILTSTQISLSQGLNDNFYWSHEDSQDKKILLPRWEQIALKSEKITGAIDFILKITELKSITETDGFISRIEATCKNVQPVIEKEIHSLNSEIPEDEARLQKIIQELQLIMPTEEKLKKEREKRMEGLLKVIKYPKNITSEEGLDFYLDGILDRYMQESYPHYEDHKNKFSDLTINLNSQSNLVKTKNTILGQLKSQAKKIEYHFKSKNS